jgi:hypothetical protein
MDIPKQNTGLIEGRRDTDYVGGTLPYEVRNESGDWRPYLVKEERQYSDNTDTMACVSFSANNALEIQHKFLTGEEVNFSDRFLAKMSGTTHQGNWQYIVADTIRKYGLVTEDQWPTLANYTWDSYYASIPQEVINKAQKLDAAYEWEVTTPQALKDHLKHAPLQITIPAPHPNHAVVLVAIEGNTAYYFDTYPPYLKTIDVSKISSALKLVLTIKKMNPNIVIYKNGSEYQVAVRMTSEEGFAQKLVETGCYNLIGQNGKPNFAEIDKIVTVL